MIDGTPERFWGWRYGDYLISTDSPPAAATGIGPYTVALVTVGEDMSLILSYVGRASSYADALIVATTHASAAREG